MCLEYRKSCNVFKNTNHIIITIYCRTDCLPCHGVEMDRVIYVLIVIIVVVAAISHFVLLILKTDKNADYSYHTVAAPALLAYGLGTVFFLVWSLLWFSVRRNIPRGLGFLGMAVLAAGTFWTTLALARKFDFVATITYLEALLPATVALLVAGVLFLASILVYPPRRK